MRSRTFTALCLLFSLAIVLALLRILPIGTVTFPQSPARVGEHARLTLPRFLIPREIITEGWPLPGGNFGLVADPHTRFTSQTAFMGEVGHGIRTPLFLRAFDINWAFSSERLQESVLIIESSAEVYSIKSADFELAPFGEKNAPLIIGVGKSGIAIYLQSISPRSGDRQAQITEGLLVLPFPMESSVAKIVSPDMEEIWRQEVEKVKRWEFDQQTSRSFCQSRWIPTIEFWRVELGRDCAD